MNQDSVITILDTICNIPSYWIPKSNTTEEDSEHTLADFIFERLRQKKYLTVEKQYISNERYNVFAYSGTVESVELLIVSHIDTVRPSIGWTKKPGTIEHDRYYHLGACDTKDGIAATLDALDTVEPLKNVAFLFYVDEEYYFEGMKTFIQKQLPFSNLSFVLSTCGANEKYQDGCRGCYEFEFIITGESGHASKKTNGRNAIDAMNFVLHDLQSYVYSFDTPYASSCNVAAIAGGSLTNSILLPTTDATPTFAASGNKIPNTAWAKIDIRPGTPILTIENIKMTIESSLANWNKTQTKPDTSAFISDWHIAFAYPGYTSKKINEAENPIYQSFKPFFESNGPHNPETSGYLDVAMIANLYPQTSCVLMGPSGGNQHKADEWTSISSTIKYRDCLIDLLSTYTK